MHLLTIGESFFAGLDRATKRNPTASFYTVGVMAAWRFNKTARWVRSLSTEQRGVLASKSRPHGKQLARESRERKAARRRSGSRRQQRATAFCSGGRANGPAEPAATGGQGAFVTHIRLVALGGIYPLPFSRVLLVRARRGAGISFVHVVAS